MPTSDQNNPESLDSWNDAHRIANEKLLRLEEELDVLLECIRESREKRTEISQNRRKRPDTPASEKTLSDSSKYRKFVEEYMGLVNEAKALDEQVKILTQECASSRAECRRCLRNIDILSSTKHKPHNVRHRWMILPLWRSNNLAAEQTILQSRIEWSGFTDPLTLFEEIIKFRDRFLSIGAVVGTFGAGITYTTLLSASRGRLDLISWAFTCFSVVVAFSASLQILSPRYLNPTRIGFAETLLYIHFLLVGLPLIAGLALLGLSVAFLDADAYFAQHSSQLPVIRAAGGLQIAIVGFSVILLMSGAFLFRRLDRVEVRQWFMKRLSPEDRKACPSAFSVDYILHFLPGGKGYSMYRQERLKQAHDMEVYTSRGSTGDY